MNGQSQHINLQQSETGCLNRVNSDGNVTDERRDFPAAFYFTS